MKMFNKYDMKSLMTSYINFTSCDINVSFGDVTYFSVILHSLYDLHEYKIYVSSVYSLIRGKMLSHFGYLST